MDFEKLKARFGETKQYKDRWLALYQDLYKYVIPDRDAFNVKLNYNDDGKPATTQIWDNTAMLAAYERANDLHALLMPKDRIWGKLTFNPHIFDKGFIDQNAGALDEVNERIFFYLNQSNLSRAVSSSNLDLIGGTAGVWVESIDDDTPLYFRSIPAVALYIEYSTDDVLNTCWYQCKITGRNILEIFPKYQGTAYENLKSNMDEKFSVIYGQIKQPNNKFYIYAVLDIDHLNPLFEYERNYNQIIIYRDRVRPGESDGRGIGLDLLPTIRDINRIVEYHRKNLAFKANPPMFYDNDKYFNPYSVRQWAGAMIARNPQGRNPLEALEMPVYPEILPEVQHLQDVIKRGFQVDPLGEINSPVKSASEISIRENRAQRTSSTDISRLINELPRQVYEVSAKILAERRLLTKDRSINSINTKKMNFTFQSPLYDLQKQDELNHFALNMQVKQQFFGQGAAMATIEPVEVNKFLTDRLNLPHKLFVTDDKLRQILDQVSNMTKQGALPTPSTTASQVQIPSASQIQV